VAKVKIYPDPIFLTLDSSRRAMVQSATLFQA
jgi:hypothetical protein